MSPSTPESCPAAQQTPPSVEIVEVGPRDGLQNEKRIFSTAEKLRLIDHAIAAGVRRMEATSFVHPGRVPQMADAEAVMQGVLRRPDVTYIGLCLNTRGAVRALDAGVDEVGAVCAASDGFGNANQGMSSQATVDACRAMLAEAATRNVPGHVSIAAAFGCPFDGEVRHDWVVEIARQVAAMGAIEIALCDTIGVAGPGEVDRLVRRVREVVQPLPVRVHFHNTRNTGLANIWAAIAAGATIVDTAIGGLGGCPFAPRATGNTPTEDVAYMLDRCGVETGLDLPALITASEWLSERMERQLPGMLSRAGLFPAPGPASVAP